MRTGKEGAFTLAAVVVAVDQITKKIALGSLEIGEPVRIVGEFIRFALRFNKGAAFSLSWGGPAFLTFFSVAAVVLISVLIMRCHECTKNSFLAMGAITGGAIGNLIDRILYGHVIDFIDIGTISWRWPTFNVADIAICLGGVVLIFLYRGKKKDGTSEVNTGEQR